MNFWESDFSFRLAAWHAIGAHEVFLGSGDGLPSSIAILYSSEGFIYLSFLVGMANMR
jgi:hypothetical protein